MDIKENTAVSVRIGKSGLKEGTIDEIKLQLKKKKVIKVKMLKSSMENKTKKELRDELVEKTNARLVKHIGFVITLCRK